MDQVEAIEADHAIEVTTSTELVPVATEARWWQPTPQTRPDPGFITHLIATANQAPHLARRASNADALAAYGPHISERRSVTRRTRQIV